MPILNIDNSGVVQHTARLEKMRKSAMPVAVRQTLSRAAFDVKKVTMPAESDVFTHRNKTFFKANSKVDPAKGFDIKTMQAVVGFVPKPGDKSHSVEDLEQQEEGGNIKGRAFIATPQARTGGLFSGKVKAKNRLETMRNSIVDPRKNNGNGKSNFVRSAIHAGVGGFIMNQSHDRVLEIKGIQRKADNSGTTIKTIMVDTIKKNRSAHVGATHFMRKASDKSADKMEGYYIEEAEKQFAKIK